MLRALQGDITTFKVDAIVNAANARMIPGGGVDGAINRAAGPKLGKAMREVGPISTGDAVSTPAFNLPAKYVIHAVGPIYDNRKPSVARRLLRTAYNSALMEAERLQCLTVNAPLISTGVYGYPMREAIENAVEVCGDFLEHTAVVRDVSLVAFNAPTFKLLKEAVDAWNG